MTASDRESTPSSLATRCSQCQAPLAHDQRYCVECGTRRGGLPLAIAERIDALLARGDLEALAAAGEGAAEATSSGSSGWSRSMPTPRAAAVSILVMLAFGVIVGSVVSTNAESDTGPLLLTVSPPVSATPAAPATPASPSPSTSATASAPASAGTSTSSTSGSSSSGASSSSSSSGSSGSGSSPSSSSFLPPVKHVFVIMLSDQRYDQSFGAPTNDPYLATTLVKQGELLPNYYGVAQGELANQIALISGQGPTPQTAANCPNYAPLEPGVASTEGQILGSGCIYPTAALTLADQLTNKGDTWKAYIEGIANGPRGAPTTCRHPNVNSSDPGAVASLQDPYVTWRNPFVYFDSIGKTACAKDDIGLSQLASDLKSASTTPNLSYIVPSPCDDGADAPCVPGAAAGLAAADRFLRGVVPEIEASPAYADGGLIAITFDQAPQSGTYADSSSCCDNPTQYPNLPPTTTTPTTTTPTTTTPITTTPTTTTPTTAPVTTTGGTGVPYPIAPTTTTTTPTTPTTTPTPSEMTGQTTPTGGGGEVGLLVISKYVKAGSVDSLDYFNHYSLLSSIEQLFGVTRLGYASDPALPAFGKPQYNNYGG